MKQLPISRRRRRGGALLMVVIFTSVLSIMLASVLTYSVHESKMNDRDALRIEAQNAAESLLEYGAAQLNQRWTTQMAFSDIELAPGERPLNFTSSNLVDAFAGTNVDTGSFELIGSVVPEDAQLVYVPRTNYGDLFAGKQVRFRHVRLFAKASASRGGETSTAYATSVFQLRDASLINHAIFYNMDLELHPGPKMTMNGPVHCNGDMFLLAINELLFTDKLTATGEILNSLKVAEAGDGTADWGSGSGYGEGGQRGEKVKLKIPDPNNSNNTLTRSFERDDSYGDETNSQAYYDSRWGDKNPGGQYPGGFDTWMDYSQSRWGDAVQSGDWGVEPLDPIGFDSYVPATSSTESKNYGYAIIEPVVDPTGTDSANHKGDAEAQKYAYKSGLTIKIHEAGDAPSHAVRLTTDGEAPDGSNETNYYVSFNKIRRASGGSLPTGKGNPVANGSATIDGKSYAGVHMDPVYLSEERARKIFTMHPYKESSDGTEAESGFWDRRRAQDSVTHDGGVDALRMDMQAFRSAVDDTYTGHPPEDDSATYSWETHGKGVWNDPDGDASYNPEDDYNGVVFVEFPTVTKHDAATDDGLLVSKDNMGLVVHNAKQVPDPDYNYDHVNQKPREYRDRGLALVTNNTMYVEGHFNSDGDVDTDPNKPGEGNDYTTPVTLAADSITILSQEWAQDWEDRWEDTKNTSKPGANTATEFSAALITGLTTTKEGDNSVKSGGAHNFPRFLENWSTKLLYRGSLVALFESEIGNEPWHTGYYSPPKRDWGYFEGFDVSPPPGTPFIRSPRMSFFDFLSQSDYNQGLNDLPDEWDSVKSNP